MRMKCRLAASVRTKRSNQLAGAHTLVAVAEAAGQQAEQRAGMTVNCRSVSIFSGTAEESASMWKQSIDSALAFSRIMITAEGKPM